MNDRFCHLKLLPILLATIVLQVSFAFGAVPMAEVLLQKHVETIIDDSKIDDPEVKAFKEALLSNQEWMHELCDAGEVQNPEQVIEQLFFIWKSDKKLTENPIDQAMATACALEGPRKSRTSEDTVKRYQYFKTKHRLGLLNSIYQDVSTYHRRYIASGVQSANLNTIESMKYLNREVCLPVEQYGGACSFPAYETYNPFGDSVFGPLYYSPFSNSWDNTAETIKEMGGVCGSLSNFGAAAAIANGVPATTMGEPSHCAFAILTKPDHWQAAYTGSWLRGLHTSYYGGTWGWHLYNNKSQEDWEKSKKSGDLRRLALDYLSRNEPDKAIKTIQLARRQHPYEWKNWQVSAQILKQTQTPKQAKSSDEHWQELHNDTLKYLSPISGEIAFPFLDQFIYPKLVVEDEANYETRAAILLDYQRSIKDWGIFRWKYKPQFTRQLQLLEGTAEQQDAFVIELFTIHADNINFGPPILEAQLENIGDDPERKLHFIASIAEQLQESTSTESRNVFTILAKKALPDAAKREDKKSFQFIGKMAAETYPATTIKTEPFPGVLLSSGGTFCLKNPGNRWDSPEQHWGVIEPHGGSFHTDSDSPTATVQLKGVGLLSGVNIVQTGNYGRIVGAVLQVSDNNIDWKDVYTFDKAQQIYHIDLQDKNLRASHVRVINPNNEYVHFNIFHVYGKKQA